MINITRLELGWCAACNSIQEVNELTFAKVNSQRRILLCDECLDELADKLGVTAQATTHEMPVFMMEVN